MSDNHHTHVLKALREELMEYHKLSSSSQIVLIDLVDQLSREVANLRRANRSPILSQVRQPSVAMTSNKSNCENG